MRLATVRKIWHGWVTFCIDAILPPAPFQQPDYYILGQSQWSSSLIQIQRAQNLKCYVLLLTGMQIPVRSCLDGFSHKFQRPFTHKLKATLKLVEKVLHNQKWLSEVIFQTDVISFTTSRSMSKTANASSRTCKKIAQHLPNNGNLEYRQSREHLQRKASLSTSLQNYSTQNWWVG